MVTVAETPHLPDWILVDNDVWVDGESNTIEVARLLERSLHRPGRAPQLQQRRSTFRVALDRRQPPTIAFTSRQFDIPLRGREAADRYFADVLALLAGAVSPEAASQRIRLEAMPWLLPTGRAVHDDDEADAGGPRPGRRRRDR